MKLSRYMDIEKYKDLLSTKTLYLPRYDQFEDELEGAILDYVDPNKLVYQCTEKLRRTDGTAQDERFIAWTYLDTFDPLLYEKFFLQNFTFVSCWHQGVEESSLMWEKYTEKDKQRGVMIKSDLPSLASSFEKNRYVPRSVGTIVQALSSANSSDRYEIRITFREVKYYDIKYDKLWENEISLSGLDRYLCKQKAYANEREIRVVLQIQLLPVARPNFSTLLATVNFPVGDKKTMSSLTIEKFEKMKQSYETQSSVLTGILPKPQCKPHVRFPVDITSLIKEVVINPYGNVDSDMREIQALNHEFGLSVPVKESDIKTETTPTTFFFDLPDGRTIQI